MRSGESGFSREKESIGCAYAEKKTDVKELVQGIIEADSLRRAGWAGGLETQQRAAGLGAPASTVCESVP